MTTPKIRITRRRRRVLTALMTGAHNLSFVSLARTAQVHGLTLVGFLDRLQDAELVSASRSLEEDPHCWVYRLTGAGREWAAETLGLEVAS